MAEPLVSLTICTRNRAEPLGRTLAALRGLEVPAGVCELIVVDNASTDSTAAVAARCELPQMSVRYVYEARRGKGNAYNTGMSAARGEILAFTDDDVRPACDWLTRLCAPIMAGHADAVIGSLLLAPELERPWMEAQHRLLLSSADESLPSVRRYLVGASMAFSRSVLAKVPAFDPELGPGALGFAEETLFSDQLREAGFRFAVASDAQVVHHFDPARLSRAAFVDRMVKQGRSNAYCAFHWEHQDIPCVRLHLLRSRLRLLYRHLTRRAECRPEGIPTWEIELLSDVHFYRQLLKERRRPRNYEKRGLVKLDHAGPQALPNR